MRGGVVMEEASEVGRGLVIENVSVTTITSQIQYIECLQFKSLINLSTKFNHVT